MKYTILIAPGLGGSEPEHWQSIWERENPEYIRIEQKNWHHPVCKDWVETIEREILCSNDNVVIVAHSLACITLAHWAKNTTYNIKGALLVAPPDVEREDLLKRVSGFSPIPLQKLPFKSILIASTTDQYATIERSEQFANAWGSQFVNVGDKGHINFASNLSGWDEGRTYLSELLLDINVPNKNVVKSYDFRK